MKRRKPNQENLIW